MKIIEMERKTMSGEPVGERPEYYPRDWWCVVETNEERKTYDDFLEHLGEYSGDSRDIKWNKMVIEAGHDFGLCWGDDDLYGYIMPDEDVPEVGEEMIDSDGETWVRTA